jgi:phosphoribosylglycinamide formyltransferase-1
METGKTLRLALCASGRGSNVQAILEAIRSGRLDAHVEMVISNNLNAEVMDTARRAGIPTLHLDDTLYSCVEEFAHRWLTELSQRRVNFIALAGYVKKVPEGVIHAYRHRIVNIHPALLPAFGGKSMYGKNVHEAVIAHGCKISGVTVHLVDEEYDHGPIVMQRCVEVLDEDTAETLAARVLKVEHQIYPEALQLFAHGRVSIEGQRVSILPET